MTNYHRKKIGNDNKWTYVLVPMATLDILYRQSRKGLNKPLRRKIMKVSAGNGTNAIEK